MYCCRISQRNRGLRKGMEDKSAVRFFQVLVSGAGISESDVQAMKSSMLSQ